MAFIELRRRTLLKTLIYRIVIIIFDSLIIYLLTRRVDVTLGAIGLLTVANVLIYYFYERVWNTIHWGKQSRKRKNS